MAQWLDVQQHEVNMLQFLMDEFLGPCFVSSFPSVFYTFRSFALPV